VLSHPFFKEIEMNLLMTKKIVPEFIPIIQNEGLNNFDKKITKMSNRETVLDDAVIQAIRENE
jgi:hypothetical protein